jgi:hypothetical protein
VSGKGGGGSYSLQYPPCNNVHLSVACAAYTQCLGGVAGAATVSLQYSPFNNIDLSVACAAYTQCLGGVAGAAILISILPVTMYI